MHKPADKNLLFFKISLEEFLYNRFFLGNQVIKGLKQVLSFPVIIY